MVTTTLKALGYKEEKKMNYFETMAGMKFTQGTIPHLIKEIGRLADAIEESNRLQKSEIEAVNTISVDTSAGKLCASIDIGSYGPQIGIYQQTEDGDM